MVTSKDYWTKRMDGIFDRLDKKEVKLNDELMKYYQDALTDINDKIYKFYDRYGKDNGFDYEEAIKQVRDTDLSDYVKRANNYRKGLQNDAEALKRLNAQYVTAKINRLELLKLELEFSMIQATNSQEGTLTDYLSNQSKYVYGAAVAGQAVSTLNNREIKEILSSQWSGANYSTRIWRNADVMVNALKDALVQAAIRGDNPRVTARALAKKLGSGRYVTERLVRTESTYVANQAISRRYKDSGFKQYEFVAVMDDRTSNVCRGLNGTVHKLSDFVSGDNAPAMHPNCRSRIVPSDDDLAMFDKYLDDKRGPAYNDVDEVFSESKGARNVPYTYKPNGVAMYEKYDDIPERKRYYDGVGKPMRDVDYSNHGNPAMHPIVPHVHDWMDGKRSKEVRGLNEDEY